MENYDAVYIAFNNTIIVALTNCARGGHICLSKQFFEMLFWAFPRISLLHVSYAGGNKMKIQLDQLCKAKESGFSVDEFVAGHCDPLT